jgi:hypothetical protein
MVRGLVNTYITELQVTATDVDNTELQVTATDVDNETLVQKKQ